MSLRRFAALNVWRATVCWLIIVVNFASETCSADWLDLLPSFKLPRNKLLLVLSGPASWLFGCEVRMIFRRVLSISLWHCRLSLWVVRVLFISKRVRINYLPLWGKTQVTELFFKIFQLLIKVLFLLIEVSHNLLNLAIRRVLIVVAGLVTWSLQFYTFCMSLLLFLICLHLSDALLVLVRHVIDFISWHLCSLRFSFVSFVFLSSVDFISVSLVVGPRRLRVPLAYMLISQRWALRTLLLLDPSWFPRVVVVSLTSLIGIFTCWVTTSAIKSWSFALLNWRCRSCILKWNTLVVSLHELSRRNALISTWRLAARISITALLPQYLILLRLFTDSSILMCN
jgi:hypothetical protein